MEKLTEEDINDINTAFSCEEVYRYLKNIIPKLNLQKTIVVPTDKKSELACLIYKECNLGSDEKNWYTAEKLLNFTRSFSG